MKYGEQFEKESVPEWSLHNIDYNSLKHHIKVHTTKHQATAIAIPGYQDVALAKFEDELYTELCRQHDRVDLFVTSKADEISRRLQHCSNQIHRLIVRSTTSDRQRVSIKRQRRFIKYEEDLTRLGEEILDLERFVNAQVVAFRKILKKYRKWTGSSSLGSRFRETVLSDPKSFSKRDFSQLLAQYDDLLATLKAATPVELESAPTLATEPMPDSHQAVGQQSSQALSTPTVTFAEDSMPPVERGYWNEYDNGSDGGDFDQNIDSSYAIYINPDDDESFPGMATLVTMFTMPVEKLREWLKKNKRGERSPLLPRHGGVYGSIMSPSGSTLTDTEAEDDDPNALAYSRRGSYGYASSEDFPTGYEAHYASLPSINDQRMAIYREQTLIWGTIASFVAAFVFLGVASVLIMTGRHKLRIEVDAGVSLGVMASLGCACAALGMTFARQGRVTLASKLAVWTTFATVCVLNGAILVLVVGNTTL